MGLKRDRNLGFTLMELIVVIAIIVVLASIAVPSYRALMDHAKNKVALANINIIRKFVTATITGDEFTDEEIFTYTQNQSTMDKDVNYLSRYIETEWENAGDPGDSDNSNYINILNPESFKSGIVNWHSLVGLCNSNKLYRNQSLYITDSHYFSYTPDSPKQFDVDYFNASLIMWYDDSVADNIYFYYVDQKGNQSGEYYVLENSSNS